MEENKTSEVQEALKRSGSKIASDVTNDVNQITNSGLLKNPIAIVVLILAIGYAMRDTSSLIQAFFIGFALLIIRSFNREGGGKDLMIITGSAVNKATDAAKGAANAVSSLKKGKDKAPEEKVVEVKPVGVSPDAEKK